MNADDALAALAQRGFRSVVAPDRSVLLTFAWEAPYTDVVHIRAEDDATGVRSSDDYAGPNLFDPDGVVWKAEGGFVEVATHLLALPAPGEPGAPTRVVATPSRLWTPGDGSLLPPLLGPVPFL